MGKGNIQARGQQNVILALAGRRVGDIDITERILPAQPLVDLGDGSQVESAAKFSRLIEIREEVELLGQHGAKPEFVEKFLAQSGGNQIVVDPGQPGIVFTGVVQAAQEVEGGALVLDGMQAEAAAEYGAQVEVL